MRCPVLSLSCGILPSLPTISIADTQNASYAFVFPNELEANDFYKKVANRSKYAVKAKEKEERRAERAAEKAAAAQEKAAAASSSSAAAGGGGGTPKKKGLGSKLKGKVIDKSMISGPKTDSFKHVAHMGYDSKSGFSSVGVDSSWQTLLEQLSAKGISAKDIQENEAFIKDYVEQRGGPEAVSSALLCMIVHVEGLCAYGASFGGAGLVLPSIDSVWAKQNGPGGRKREGGGGGLGS